MIYNKVLSERNAKINYNNTILCPIIILTVIISLFQNFRGPLFLSFRAFNKNPTKKTERKLKYAPIFKMFK